MTCLLSGLDPHWWWLLAAALLGILEILVPGIFLIWMALAAGITGLDRRASADALPLPARHSSPCSPSPPSMPAAASMPATRSPSADPKLNDRAARLIGQTVTVVTAIENGKGRVTGRRQRLERARAGRAERGEGARRGGGDGTCLTVEAAG